MSDSVGRPENLWAWGLNDIELKVEMMSREQIDKQIDAIVKPEFRNMKLHIGKPISNCRCFF